MIINTFLLKNPELPIQGVIFQSPFFGFSKNFRLNWFKLGIIKLFEPLLYVSAALWLPVVGILFINVDQDSLCVSKQSLHAVFDSGQKEHPFCERNFNHFDERRNQESPAAF